MVELIQASRSAAGKIQFAIENRRQIERLIPPANQPRATRFQGIAFNGTGWRNDPNRVAGLQRSRSYAFRLGKGRHSVGQS